MAKRKKPVGFPSYRAAARFLAQRAAAASFPILLNSAFVSAFARAFPPFRPSATAAGFFPITTAKYRG